MSSPGVNDSKSGHKRGHDMKTRNDAGRINRVTRRHAVVGGSAGLAALALAGGQRAVGQEATPATRPEGTPNAAGVSLLFVQSFAAAELVPAADDPAVLTLTLEGDTGRTLYFADRPSRLVGIVDTTTFVAEFGAETANDPANAALVGRVDGGEEAIHVVELLELRFDAATNRAVYRVRVLDDPTEIGLGFAGRTEQTIDGVRRYGASQLFIDAGGLMQIVAYGAQDVYLDGTAPGTE